jgi:hypothetical protein
VNALPDEKLRLSLDAMLRDADAALASGLTSRACSKLAQFIRERGRGLAARSLR